MMYELNVMELYTEHGYSSYEERCLLFGKGGGSLNSHEMRLFGMPSMGLLISPNLRTYTANIWIWPGSIPMCASMFWVTLAGDSTSIWCGVS